MSSETGLREGLLGLEPLNPDMQQRFEREIRELAEGRLTRGARVNWWLFLIGCVLLALFLGYNLVVAWWRIWGTLGMAIVICLAATLGVGTFAGVTLLRGRARIGRQLDMGKLLPAFGLIVVFLSFLYGAEDPRRPGAVWFGVYALAVLVITTGINLWNHIMAADLHAQEHFLRLEYRLADLASRLPRDHQGPSCSVKNPGAE